MITGRKAVEKGGSLLATVRKQIFIVPEEVSEKEGKPVRCERRATKILSSSELTLNQNILSAETYKKQNRYMVN